MTTQTQSLTQGVHHVGLTVKDLTATVEFFESVLGFKKKGEVPAYPAAFVSDGNIMLALWQAQTSKAIEFDRKGNIGLHHLAFKVDGKDNLNQLHQRLIESQGVNIEFAPEPLMGGPSQHMMITEPGGIRIEFITPAQ